MQDVGPVLSVHLPAEVLAQDRQQFRFAEDDVFITQHQQLRICQQGAIAEHGLVHCRGLLDHEFIDRHLLHQLANVLEIAPRA